MTTNADTRAIVIQLFINQVKPDFEVDCEKLAEVLGFSSMEQIAFLKSVNAEFGTNITVEDLEKARGKGGLLSLLPKR